MNEGTGNQGKHKAYLPAEDFARIVRLTPLASIDMALIDDRGMALLGKRTYEPAKGLWFVPGGRIAKDESLDDAFACILKAETGLACPAAGRPSWAHTSTFTRRTVLRKPAMEPTTSCWAIGYRWTCGLS